MSHIRYTQMVRPD